MSVRIKLCFWMVVVAIAVLGMRWMMTTYSVDELQAAVQEYRWYVLAGYAVLISFRGLLFVPTLPVILLMASTIEARWMFVVTFIASCCSAYLVCLAVDYLDVQKRLKSIPNRSIHRAQKWIRRMGVSAVAGWAFFPLVFTEIIVYLARMSGMKKKRIIAAVAVGEGALIWLIMNVSQGLISLLQ